MKLLNDLMQQFNESVETGPKFTGQWKAKDPAPPGKKLVGEEANPTDVVAVNIPLLLRLMEYAKEDAKTDMDLHNVTERAIELMQQNEHLSMDHYDALVGGQATGGEQPTNEAAGKNSLKDFVPPYSANGLWVSDRRGNSVLEVTRHGKLAQQVADALNQYSSTNISEAKKKGVDGKACWKGYRYAGTEGGKDKCVPVKKGK